MRQLYTGLLAAALIFISTFCKAQLNPNPGCVLSKQVPEQPGHGRARQGT